MALLLLAAVLSDDLDDFETMMAEPAERGGWIDPMDMGLEIGGGGLQGCDLGAVGKELRVCKEALKRALERNETSSKPVQVLMIEAQSVWWNLFHLKEAATTDAFLKRHVSHLLARYPSIL